jgi:hypothetical protein
MYYKPNEDTDIKLSVTIDGVAVPYLYSNKEPFNHKLSEKYAGYCSIHSDLNQSFNLLDKCYGKLNDSIMDETLWKQAILLIGRTFSTGEGRGVKLESSNFSTENGLRQYLESIINIRNTFIAHHGFTQMSHFMTVITLTNPNISKGISSVGQASVQLSSESETEVEQLKLLIRILIQWTEDKLRQLEPKIFTDFQNMDIDDLYEKSFKP